MTALIPGAVLTVKDKDGNVVDTWTSEKGVKHPISGLKVGETYTLTEELAPDGYVRAETITFTVLNDFQIQTVVMKDKYTKVKISKQDITTKEEIPGAVLIIKDSKGKEIEKWTSTDKPHYIKRLPVGKYTLTEITAPDGYKKTETVKFKVKETGKVQKVVMYDEPIPKPTGGGSTPGVSTPKTGDTFPVQAAAAVAVVVVVLVALGVFLVVRGKKRK